MPTVRGILRRGLTIDGLKEFIIAQGSSRSVVVMEWDKLWVFNRKIIDPKAVRYMGIEKENAVKVNVDNVDSISEIEVDCHPKNPELKKRKMKVSKQLLIDQIDAVLIEENNFVTFMNLGNVLINKIVKDANGVVKEISGRFDPTNKDFKKTLKVTWLDSTNAIGAQCCYYENLIEKPILDKDNDEFRDYVNKESEIKVDFLVERALADLKKGDIIQILRKGFFICDQLYDKNALSHTSLDSKIALFSIADGTTDLTNYPKVVQDAKLRLREKIASFAEIKKQSTKNQQEQSKAPNDANAILLKIQQQGDEIRELKARPNKPSKEELKPHIDNLLKLKTEFKNLTGKDWTPSSTSSSNQPKQQAQQPNDANAILLKIQQQGDEIRELKARPNKPSKEELKPHIDNLLKLKTEFKNLTGEDWTPSSTSSSNQPKSQQQSTKQEQTSATSDANTILLKIQQQGDKIKELKTSKAPKDQWMPLVDALLKFKEEYKNVTGQEWKPGLIPSSTPANNASAAVATTSSNTTKTSNSAEDELNRKITEQGDKIRELKARPTKPSKEELKPHIDNLLKLKTEFKNLTGKDWTPSSTPASNQPKQQAQQQQSTKKEKQPAKQPQQSTESDKRKRQTKLGMETKKSENFSEWYTEVITKSEMIDYYDISGCYVLWEWSFGIWEKITEFLNNKIKSEGVKNVGFPLFVSKRSLEVEKNHIADFAPEVAWVTKSGTSDMQEPIAIRPTSETVMYPYFAKRIKSHRDLPVKVNQWCNVVRWEFKDPTPFLRTREFYWQEGHTAHATKEEAIKEVYAILDHYASVYEHLLAIPVIKGKKTEKEKFPGGDMTTTIEGFISENGRGIQAATSHFLGQNFSKMFDIVFSNLDKKREYAYQNSWGFTTRSIGVMVMEHSDDKGLVLPPLVAPIQVIIIPCGITVNTSDADKNKLLDAVNQLESELKTGGILVEQDSSDHNTPGWKFSHWELKGKFGLFKSLQ